MTNLQPWRSFSSSISHFRALGSPPDLEPCPARSISQKNEFFLWHFQPPGRIQSPEKNAYHRRFLSVFTFSGMALSSEALSSVPQFIFFGSITADVEFLWEVTPLAVMMVANTSTASQESVGVPSKPAKFCWETWAGIRDEQLRLPRTKVGVDWCVNCCRSSICECSFNQNLSETSATLDGDLLKECSLHIHAWTESDMERPKNSYVECPLKSEKWDNGWTLRWNVLVWFQVMLANT